ncbi:MAG: GAF domain-containing protein [Chloroflexota bacterium]
MNNKYQSSILLNVQRLMVLRDLSLLDNEFETTYDQFTQLASQIMKTNVSLVSMVASNYQFFKSYVGLPEPWKSRRQTPLSHSFCQHVVINNEPLVVTDARQHETLKNNQAIPDLSVIGYLGIPLTLSNKTSLGSFCVIDSEPREWSDVDVKIMTELANILVLEFEVRAQLKIGVATSEDLKTTQQAIQSLIDDVDIHQPLEDILKQIKMLRQEYNLV